MPYLIFAFSWFGFFSCIWLAPGSICKRKPLSHTQGVQKRRKFHSRLIFFVVSSTYEKTDYEDLTNCFSFLSFKKKCQQRRAPDLVHHLMINVPIMIQNRFALHNMFKVEILLNSFRLRVLFYVPELSSCKRKSNEIGFFNDLIHSTVRGSRCTIQW